MADGELEYDITANSRGFESPLRDANAMIGRLGGGIRGLLAPTMALVGVAGGLAGLGKIVGGAAELEQMGIAFEVMTGSAERGKRLLEEIREMGAATPYEFPALAKGGQTLLNFGIAADEVIPTLSMLGDIAAGDEQKLGSLALVFGQIASTGRLMGGDLLQLINAGFNPLQVISERTGESMASLKDRMEKGAISIDEVKGAFVAATSQGGRFFGMMERQSGTTAGLFSTLKDEINSLFLIFGRPINDALKPILSGAIEGVGRLRTQIEEIGETAATVMQRAFAANNLGMLTDWLKSEFMVIGADFLNYLGVGLNKAFNGLADFINSVIPAIGRSFTGALLGAGAAFAGFIVEKMGAAMAAVLENMPGMEDQAASMRAMSARKRTEIELGGQTEAGSVAREGQSMLKAALDAMIRGAAGGKVVEDAERAALIEERDKKRKVLDDWTAAHEAEAAEIKECEKAAGEYGVAMGDAAKVTQKAAAATGATTDTPPAPPLLTVPDLMNPEGSGGGDALGMPKIRLFGLEESEKRREGRMSAADRAKREGGYGRSLLDEFAAAPSGLLSDAAADAAAGAPAVAPPRARGAGAGGSRPAPEASLISILKEISANTAPLKQLATA